MSINSIKLNESFEKYRKSPSYEKEVANRMKVLDKFGFNPKFIDALARFSIDTGIRISELLDPENRELLLSEDSNLTEALASLDREQNKKTRREILNSTKREEERKAA